MKEVAKQWLVEFLGPAYPWFRDFVIRPIYDPISGFWDPRASLFVPYLLSAILLAMFVYNRQQTRSQSTFSFRQFLRYLAPARIYLHKSAILDYKFLFVRALVNQVFLSVFAVGSGLWLAGPVGSLIALAFGPGPSLEPTVVSRFLFTVFMTLAVEFGHYLGHYLEHRVPLLWEFHKTHHSCEVLTPVSAYRNHPVDQLVKSVTVSSSSALVLGVYSYLYPGGIREFEILSISVIFFLSYLVANLLHSHIWLSYGWRMNHVLMAPCMHQIHHSSEKRHFDRNFANFFSFWDWLFGTIYVPRSKETFDLGISGNGHARFDSVWNLYFVPFQNAYHLVFRRPRQPRKNEAS